MRIHIAQTYICGKSFEFAVRIVNLSKYLMRCGTSIGVNIAEAQRGQSKADFLAKMSIALKEANETHYWLRLLYRTEYLNKNQFESMEKDIQELLGILTAICKTTSPSQNK